ncbi:hypothetical protein ACFPPD_25520 [Cohnella suwonensis]|uniref:Aminodeoxychorismate lyase n=1 Tax=Cohnella suwonensis TaxID=696072 RepID=A0ABW0M3A0_9BACL
MRKHRNWLIGLGIGIMLGSSMLQLITFAKDQTESVADVALTREQLNVQAEKNGLVLLTDEELQQRLEEAATAAKTGAQGEAGKAEQPSASPSPEKEAAPASESPSPSAAAPNPPDEPVTSQSNDKATLYIGAGMSLTEVANGLKKLGIVDDAKDFVERARPIAKKMNVGNAIFTGKPTYDQIIAELVRKKR